QIKGTKFYVLFMQAYSAWSAINYLSSDIEKTKTLDKLTKHIAVPS
ncbi:15950_t:CDS:1, partial [Racocetra persica]